MNVKKENVSKRRKIEEEQVVLKSCKEEIIDNVKLESVEENGKQEANDQTKDLPIWQEVDLWEENIAQKNDPDDDLEDFKELCNSFESLLNEADKLKASKPKENEDKSEWTAEMDQIRRSITLIMLDMKELNRVEKVRTKNMRSNLSRVKQQVDAYQLQLQNLLCEIIHLKKEVDKCLHFKSKDLGIDLVPVTKFYNEAPPSISRPEVTKTDEHQLQLARLEWELKQRKELALHCEQLESSKQIVTTQIRKKRSDLDNLAPLIKDVLAVTKPMQENLGFPMSKSSKNFQIASLLPHPLYYLCVQADAYREACDKNLSVKIGGDEEEAKIFKVESCDLSSEEDSDSDTQEEEKEHHRKKGKSVKKEERQKQLFTKHPLFLEIAIRFKGGDCMILKFQYLVNLNVMTVMPSLEIVKPVSSISATQLLSNSNILSGLFPGDYGQESPNVANYYQMKQIGVDRFDTESLGIPYVWVQRLGGLDFAKLVNNKNAKVEADRELALTSMPTITKEIRRRVRARLALAKQVIALENGHVTGPVSMSSVKLSCCLKHWEVILWADYRRYDATQKFIEAQYISSHDLFYKATLVRADARMIVLVGVKPSYPSTSPVFALTLEKDGKCFSSSTNNDIRDIEREVNVHWKELTSDRGWAYNLLTYQIHRIMVCFDIFLECESPQKYSAEKKTFFHPVRGRNRAHPYKYVPIGEGVFTQR